MTTEVIDLIINLSGVVVVLGQILLIFLILLYILLKLNKKNKQLKSIFNFISENALSFSFLVATTATIGSLFLSQIAKIPPCDLCWYQRIFMFPLTIILGIALFKDDLQVKRYVVPLALIGIAIAFYHYILQRLPTLPLPCTNEVVSCTTKQIELFGYITIPLMSATAFGLIILVLLFSGKKS